MPINDIIQKLQLSHSSYGITLYPPATMKQIEYFQHAYSISFPDDIKEFYLFCNGFESDEDMFRVVPLDELGDRGKGDQPNSFYIAEYLIYCDMWSIKINPANKNDYFIYYEGDNYCVFTKSFTRFLEKFLTGGVYDKGGLYEWYREAIN